MTRTRGVYLHAALDAELGFLRNMSSGRACAAFRAAAFVFGSVVRGDEGAEGDVDVMVVAGVGLRAVSGGAERGLGEAGP